MQAFSTKPIPTAELEHTFFSRKVILSHIGTILSIAQIINFVMASAAESELAALCITVREMIPHYQTLINMGWPQPKKPIQSDSFAAARVTNKTIIPRRSKMMDL